MQKIAVLAGGCFWGMEELFRKVPGVLDTETGYTGGKNAYPTYRYHPGHAEALKIIYDDEQISFVQLLDFFFQVHDPTTQDQQGNDVGTSYRSSIFVTDDHERRVAEEMIARVNASHRWRMPIVTRIEPLGEFYPAEAEHQDYLQKYPQGYTCHFIRSGGSYLEK